MQITHHGPQSVGDIIRYFTFGNLYLSPEEYQRENAWDLAQKQLLIDTIFRGLDIPKFYLWKIDESTLARGYPENEVRELYKELLAKKRKDDDDIDPHIFEVVDGQQRIRTILEYVGASPPNTQCIRGPLLPPFRTLQETPMAKAKLHSELNVGPTIRFEQCPLTVMVLENFVIDDIRDMFLRLQNGTPLNAQQKRNAMGSTVGKIAKELALLPFFTQSVNFPNNQSGHCLVASQMIQLELKNQIVSCTSQQMDKLYKYYCKASIDPLIIARTRKVIKILGKIFPTKSRHLNQNYALTLYWLLSRILLTYEIAEQDYDKIRSNFEKLDRERIKANLRDYVQADDEFFRDLSLAMSRGNTGVDGISTRHTIVGQFLFQDVNLVELPNLDPRRNFTYEEKLILYHQAEGRCQITRAGGTPCGREIQFDESVVDHITPHSRGGTTELANGRIAHNSCNIARSNRDSFNPATDCHLI